MRYARNHRAGGRSLSALTSLARADLGKSEMSQHTIVKRTDVLTSAVATVEALTVGAPPGVQRTLGNRAGAIAAPVAAPRRWVRRIRACGGCQSNPREKQSADGTAGEREKLEQ